MSKEIKESMAILFHQIENTSKETEIIKKKNLGLKSKKLK